VSVWLRKIVALGDLMALDKSENHHQELCLSILIRKIGLRNTYGVFDQRSFFVAEGGDN
jgi:hypothetical protein